MLGGSFEGIVDANLLPWAQLAWGAGGGQRDTAAAASLVQRLDWQEMAFTLPGKQSQPLHLSSRAFPQPWECHVLCHSCLEFEMQMCIYD